MIININISATGHDKVKNLFKYRKFCFARIMKIQIAFPILNAIDELKTGNFQLWFCLAQILPATGFIIQSFYQLVYYISIKYDGTAKSTHLHKSRTYQAIIGVIGTEKSKRFIEPKYQSQIAASDS